MVKAVSKMVIGCPVTSKVALFGIGPILTLWVISKIWDSVYICFVDQNKYIFCNKIVRFLGFVRRFES